MKFLNTLVALVIVAGLGGTFYYLNKHPKSETSADTTPKQKIVSFQPNQVKEFTFESPDQSAVTVRRASAPGQWEITAPSGVPADSTQIQAFVDAVPKLEQTPLESQTPSSLADYGLDQPKRSWKFKLDNGPEVTVRIGKDNPGGYARYAVVSSTPGLFLMDAADTKDFDKTLFDMRDKRVLPAAVDKAKQVELKFDFSDKTSAAEIEKAKKLGLPVKPPKIVLTHQPNGNWQVSDPNVRTDFGDTNYFVTTVSGGAMQAVEAENPKSLAEYGLDKPTIRLNVTAADGSVQSLLVGKKKEAPKDGEKKDSSSSSAGQGYYAKNSLSPTVFLINQQVFDQLNQDLDNYRNRFLFDFDTANARRLEIQGPDGELRLDRKGDDWFKGGDNQKKVDSAKVDDFLNTIHGLRIQHYTEDRPGHIADYGLGKPSLKVKVTFGEANKVETVIFAPKDKKFYAARQDESSIYEMSPNDQETVQPKLKALSS